MTRANGPKDIYIILLSSNIRSAFWGLNGECFRCVILDSLWKLYVTFVKH